MGSSIGWDVGGAHLKAARVEHGRVTQVLQLACPLWLGLDRLQAALSEACARLGSAPLHAATMTGELADIFASRAEGVTAIAACLADAVAPARLRIYGGRAGWLGADMAAARAADIASANWHATAAVAGIWRQDALLVDMGSTTTDIVPVRAGAPVAAGYTDAERLAAGELVYTGLVRTSLMALAPHVPFAGTWTPLACEHFATTADVYRILAELPDGADQMPTADGRAKTVEASRARLARMVGRDAGEAEPGAWHALAAWLAEAQLRAVADGAALVLSRTLLPPDAAVIGAGLGRRVAARLAARLGRAYEDFAALAPATAAPPEWMAYCAPSVAVALLAASDA